MGKRHNAHPKQRKRISCEETGYLPQGNMYAAVRLPMEGAFSSDAAALAVGVLLVSGLEKAGPEFF